MADDEYELLPQKLISDLKYDVEALKKKLTEPDTKTNELILEIESLKDSIHELHTIFQKALDQTQEEDLGNIIKTVNEKLQTVVSQNETIARGMIAISDKVEEWMKKQNPGAAGPSLVQHSMGMPTPTGRVAPRPMMSVPAMAEEADFPPPPPEMSSDKKKRSLGGLFK